MSVRDFAKEFPNLQQEADGCGLKITEVKLTETKVTVSVDDNPLIPQAVFAVMRCFIISGAKDADWKGTEDGVDFIAEFDPA